MSGRIVRDRLVSAAPTGVASRRTRDSYDVVKQAEERAALVTELFSNTGTGPSGRLLRTREVAILFQVSERAVTDWARKGRIPSVRTPGGHRRYPADAVRTLLQTVQEPAMVDEAVVIEAP
ncbi:MAG TPA: helix-turn-helix domain-containing protein [Acidimicrobiales bacterium]|jgi:excisionase family DNA binding protein